MEIVENGKTKATAESNCLTKLSRTAIITLCTILSWLFSACMYMTECNLSPICFVFFFSFCSSSLCIVVARIELDERYEIPATCHSNCNEYIMVKIFYTKVCLYVTKKDSNNKWNESTKLREARVEQITNSARKMYFWIKFNNWNQTDSKSSCF